MEFNEKAKIRLGHWITHNDQHQKEYEIFAEQLDAAGENESARSVREMIGLTQKSTDCLRKALEALSP